jgi:tRNA-splicing ligase RtcB
MPDVHIGYGFPVGGVAAFAAEPGGNGIISPGGIGFDINCGVRTLVTSLRQEQFAPFAQAFLELVSQLVPVGTGRDSSIRLSNEELDAVLTHGSRWALEHGYATADDLERTEESGCLAAARAAVVSTRAKERGMNQLGTLGAGNHFLEVQVVEHVLDPVAAQAFGITGVGQVLIMIHCGSRGLGHQVCTDYLERFEDEFPEIAASLSEKNLLYAPLASSVGQDYFAAMCASANFAWANRQVITHRVRGAIQRLFVDASVRVLYDVSHNIAKRESHRVEGLLRELLVHRKGATRSFGPGNTAIPECYRSVGQPVLIPGSMGTASYVLAGTQHAMDETFGTCCHGAGRQLSRTAAVATFTGATVRRELSGKGIHVMAPSKGLAEEAPAAYKDVDEVIRVVAQEGLARPVARLVPLAVLKG